MLHNIKPAFTITISSCIPLLNCELSTACHVGFDSLNCNKTSSVFIYRNTGLTLPVYSFAILAFEHPVLRPGLPMILSRYCDDPGVVFVITQTYVLP